MTVGPCVPADITELNGLPVLLPPRPFVLQTELCIPVEQAAQALWLTGCTSMPQGWPIGGAWGDPVLECVLEYADGGCESLLLRNGADITTATALYGPSRIDPQAANSARALYLIHDSDFERYVVNLRRLPADPARLLRSLRLRPVGSGYLPLVYAVTVRR
jgi:hypothetical protein